MDLDGDFMDEVYPRNIYNQRAARKIQSAVRGFQNRSYRMRDAYGRIMPMRGILNLQREASRRGYGGARDYRAYRYALDGVYGHDYTRRYRQIPLYRRMQRDQHQSGLPYWQR